MALVQWTRNQESKLKAGEAELDAQVKTRDVIILALKAQIGQR